MFDAYHLLLKVFIVILIVADGALNPPHFYISCAEIDVALHRAGQDAPTHLSNNDDAVRNNTFTVAPSAATQMPSVTGRPPATVVQPA